MPRLSPMLAAVLAATLLLDVSTAHASPGAIVRARALMEKGKTIAAVECLEEALLDAPADGQAAILDALRRAYAAAAKEAEARGHEAEAELFRDNLEILNRGQPPALAPVPETAPAPSHAPSSPSAPSAELPANSPAKPWLETPAPGRLVVADPAGAAARPATPPDPAPAPAPLPEPAPVPAPGTSPAPAPAAVDVATADAAFRARRYAEAGEIYAALDREGRLPAGRRDHWAYCRWAEVVRRINARPATPEEWAEIDAEIQRIRVLSPNNWYGEYLRNRAADRTVGGRGVLGMKRSRRLLVRGSAPEEPPIGVPPDPKSKKPALSSAGQPAPPPNDDAISLAAAPAPSQAPGPARTSPRPAPAPASGQWQVRETPSFRILHNDPELAEKAAEVAEAAREVQVRHWTGAAPKGPWSPKCDIYLYPTARVYGQMTGQPEESPGFSTMGINGGRVIARRVNLRVDHPNLLKAIMPHEITHVVLADLFPHQQIPRWADEGIAVLSEPHSEQHLRAADLEEPLGSGRLFKVADLMAMDYPDGKYWGLYYAQSVSLTRFLVEQGTPTQFIQFVQRSQLNGPETELKRIYRINGFADLHNRWLSYARSKTNEVTATSDDPNARSVTTRR